MHVRCFEISFFLGRILKFQLARTKFDERKIYENSMKINKTYGSIS